MQRSKAVEMYKLIRAQLEDTMELTKITVVIVERNDILELGLDMEYYQKDAFPELDGIWPSSGRMTLTIKTDEKPFTYKELVKISKVWKELLKLESIVHIDAD